MYTVCSKRNMCDSSATSGITFVSHALLLLHCNAVLLNGGCYFPLLGSQLRCSSCLALDICRRAPWAWRAFIAWLANPSANGQILLHMYFYKSTSQLFYGNYKNLSLLLVSEGTKKRERCILLPWKGWSRWVLIIQQTSPLCTSLLLRR
jgi:hypothetical protein